MACIPIASQIVKETVPEFSDMSLDDIGKCFLSVDSACIGVDPEIIKEVIQENLPNFSDEQLEAAKKEAASK